MKTHSAKAKGRRLQKDVKERLKSVLGLPDDAVYSASSGCPGTDVRVRIGNNIYSFECANQEHVSIWKKWDQCETNARNEKGVPVLVIAKNNTAPLAVIELDVLMDYLWYRKSHKPVETVK